MTSQSPSRCPLCNGSTWILNTNPNGYEYSSPCTCRQKVLQNGKHVFAEMPELLRNLKVNDFKTDIYSNDINQALALKARKIVTSYVNKFEELREKKKGLYLYSKTKGSGKTHLAVSLGNALIDKYGVSVKFATTTNILTEIRGTFDNKEISFSQYMEDIKRADVLIMDDIGTERLSGWVNETFYEIINQRMLKGRITIYTSNCVVEDLKHDDRIKSRISGCVYPVKFPEEDIRGKLNSEDNIEIEKLLGVSI